MLKRRVSPAFTLIELMIVIVVIAVLAGIVFVGYRGIQFQATEAAIQQELKQAATKLESFKITGASQAYPTSLNEVGLAAGESRTFSYNPSNGNGEYCLASTGNGRTYYITNADKIPRPGICNGSTGVAGTGNVSEDLTPQAPVVVASSAAPKFEWNEVVCVSGMSPSYRWEWQIVGGSSGQQASWLTSREQTVNSEGSQVTGTVYARCSSGNNHSNEVSAPFDVGMPIFTTPTLSAISIGSDSNSSWSASGCPAGTSAQYQWRRDTAREAGSYNAYSAWGMGTSSGVTIGYDDQVTYQVQSRCTNTTSNVSGPVATSTSGTFTRGIPAPSAPGWGRHVVSNNTNMWWYGVSCAAGYPVYNMWIVRRSTGATQWGTGYTTATSVTRPSLPVASWDSHLMAYCQGTYTTSGWSWDNVAYT